MRKAPKPEFSPIRLIEDQPVDLLERDYLGLSPWAKIISGTAVGTPGPFTIGVHGMWGYGKTTLLKLAKAFVDRDYPAVVTVWFNAWQFEREEHPLFPLIAAIADEIERKSEKTPGDKGREGLRKIGLSLRALTRGMKFKGEVGMPLVGKVGVEFDAQKALDAEDLLGKQTNPLLAEMMYHSAFNVLEEATRKEGREEGVKIVVFVDDLDRCHPDKAVFLLESVKLILAQPGFIFVLAVDRTVIEKHLEKRYCELCGEGMGDRGAFYMEKIIQLPIIIPNHRSRFGEFVKRIVEDLGSKDGGPEIDALKNVQAVLATGAGTNPRSLIRLVNNFLLDCKLWPLIEHEEKYQDLSKDVAAALAFNRILHHDLGDTLYAALVADQEICDAMLGDKLDSFGERAYLEVKSACLEVPSVPGVKHMPGPKEAEDDRQGELVRRLKSRTDLVDALQKHGQAWLTYGELRRVVHEFAQVERAAPGPVEFPEPIAEAIREVLELEQGEPIPAARVAEVRGLDLSGTQVTDAALAHLKGLSNLEALDLSGTQVTDAGLAHLKGLSNVNVLYLGRTQVTDAGLAHVKGLSNLRRLGLGVTQVTDAGLLHLKGLSKLEVLELSGTQVTDSGIAHLKGLPNLRILFASGTQVTDAGLAHLKTLSNLAGLGLSGTQVTDAGVEMLKKALPNLRVRR